MDEKFSHTDFNPRTFKLSCGDGCFIYPGENGPLPSIRLENLRNGIEDWELIKLVRDKMNGNMQSNEEINNLILKIVGNGCSYSYNPELMEEIKIAFLEMLEDK